MRYNTYNSLLNQLSQLKCMSKRLCDPPESLHYEYISRLNNMPNCTCSGYNTHKQTHKAQKPNISKIHKTFVNSFLLPFGTSSKHLYTETRKLLIITASTKKCKWIYYREDKDFSNKVYSSLNGFLLIQRTYLNISRVTMDSSLHSCRDSMI